MVRLSNVRPIPDLAAQGNFDVGGHPVRPGDVVRVYVAAPRASARQARALVLALRTPHFPAIRLVSRWINRCIDDPGDPASEDERRTILANNVIDIGWADVVVALMHRGAPRATMGDIVWALANDTPVVWIANDDEGRNIWDAHGLVVRVSVEDPFRSIPEISVAIRDAIALAATPLEPSRRGWRGGAPPGEATRPRTQAEQSAGARIRPADEEQAS
jgi:hypothetical protein